MPTLHWLGRGIIARAARNAALLAALLAGAVFYHHLSPEVTLKDSGELVTAAFTFGVPHPPGFPLWTLLAFIWSHFVLPFGNPAWRIGVFSAVTGAALVGVMALTMIRSIRALLDSLPWSGSVEERLRRRIALSTGFSIALLFGFNRAVWYWACVPEMRTLYLLMAVLTSCAFLGWAANPRRRGFLDAAVLLFGVSFIANGSYGYIATALAIAILAGALASGIEQFILARRETPGQPGVFRAFMTSLAALWELCTAGLLCFMVWLLVLRWLCPMSYDPDRVLRLTVAVILAALLAVGGLTGWWSLRRTLAYAGCLLAGLAAYLYVPLAASTNPPLNWGYAATNTGFLHVWSIGCYQSWWSLMPTSKILPMLKDFAGLLREQYSLPLTLLGLATLAVPAFSRSRVRPCGRAGLLFVWVAFFATSLAVVPSLLWGIRDKESMMALVAPAHAFYAMLIALGIAAILNLAAGRGSHAAGAVVWWICLGLLALPLVTFTRNWPACSLRGHDFGYRFGHLMFEPGEGYPPMEQSAILFAGTDAVRFVSTYMIFCESRVTSRDRFRDKAFDRSDVYIIAQNALADNTYESCLRDQYDFSRPDANRPETIAQYPAWRQFVFKLGRKCLHRDHVYPMTPIHIPSPKDANRAFQQYVEDMQAGRIPAGTDISVQNGRVSVQSISGVFLIDGILARWVFDRNKDSHAFYVEESYVISWMYPHLRPFGVVMRLENDPLPSPQQEPTLWDNIVARDRAYWDRLTGELLARAEFRRDSDAKKSFSKLRVAIAGLYAFRGLFSEAEYAFRQALQLCPESIEANFRLADLYLRNSRYVEARKVMEDYLKLDESNSNARNYLESLKSAQKDDARRQELEKEMARNKAVEFKTELELATIYQRLKMDPQFKEVARGMLSGTNLQPAAYAAIEQLCVNGHQWELLTNALQCHLAYEPKEYRVWIDLAVAEYYLSRPMNVLAPLPADLLAALQRAVETGGDDARAVLRQDPRFAPLRNTPEFQSLIPASSP